MQRPGIFKKHLTGHGKKLGFIQGGIGRQNRSLLQVLLPFPGHDIDPGIAAPAPGITLLIADLLKKNVPIKLPMDALPIITACIDHGRLWKPDYPAIGTPALLSGRRRLKFPFLIPIFPGPSEARPAHNFPAPYFHVRWPHPGLADLFQRLGAPQLFG